MQKRIPLGVLGVLCALTAPVVSNAANLHVEDFGSTAYKDPVNTTADWDTLSGEVKLYPFVASAVGNYDTPGSALAVVIDGGHAFVADDAGDLQVIDITDPTSPVLAGSVAISGSAKGLAVDVNVVYVAAGFAGLITVDVTDPTNPIALGIAPTPDDLLGVHRGVGCRLDNRHGVARRWRHRSRYLASRTNCRLERSRF